MPKYIIVILYIAFQQVKQFFVSDSFVSDLVIMSLFSVIYYKNCSYI